MTTPRLFCSHTISQKWPQVLGRGPCKHNPQCASYVQTRPGARRPQAAWTKHPQASSNSPKSSLITLISNPMEAWRPGVCTTRPVWGQWAYLLASWWPSLLSVKGSSQSLTAFCTQNPSSPSFLALSHPESSLLHQLFSGCDECAFHCGGFSGCGEIGRAHV